MAFDNNILFNMCQMIVVTKTFVPYEQCDLDIILKATTAIYNLNFSNLICGTNLPQESYQADLGASVICICTRGKNVSHWNTCKYSY